MKSLITVEYGSGDVCSGIRDRLPILRGISPETLDECLIPNLEISGRIAGVLDYGFASVCEKQDRAAVAVSRFIYMYGLGEYSRWIFSVGEATAMFEQTPFEDAEKRLISMYSNYIIRSMSNFDGGYTFNLFELLKMDVRGIELYDHFNESIIRNIRSRGIPLMPAMVWY